MGSAVHLPWPNTLTYLLLSLHSAGVGGREQGGGKGQGAEIQGGKVQLVFFKG